MIREARRKLHLTQDALAPILGVSVRTIQAYEQGRRTPSKSVLMLLEMEIKRGKPKTRKDVLKAQGLELKK